MVVASSPLTTSRRLRLRLAHAGMSVPRPYECLRFSGDMLDCPPFTLAASDIAETFASWSTPWQMACSGRFTGTTFCRRT